MPERIKFKIVINVMKTLEMWAIKNHPKVVWIGDIFLFLASPHIVG